MSNKNFKRLIASMLIFSMVAVEFNFKANANNPVVVVNSAAPAAVPSSVPATASSKQISVESLRKDLTEIINPSKGTESDPNLMVPQELGKCGKTDSDTVHAIFNPANGVLYIEGKGQMADYDDQNCTTEVPWKEKITQIRTVIINDKEDSEVTSIGDFAFFSLPKLQKAIFQKVVKTIGDAAFQGCSKLTIVDFHSATALERIGIGAFQYDNEIKSLKFPISLKEIGDDAFNGCEDLYCVTFGTSVLDRIGDGAFGFCTNLYFVSYNASEPPHECSKSVFPESLEAIRVPNTYDYRTDNFGGISLKKVKPDKLAQCMTKEEEEMARLQNTIKGKFDGVLGWVTMGAGFFGAISTIVGAIFGIGKGIKYCQSYFETWTCPKCNKKVERGKNCVCGKKDLEYWFCEDCKEKVKRKAVCIKCGKGDPDPIPKEMVSPV